MPRFNAIRPCLWFDGQAHEAAQFYVSVFDDSRIVRATRYPNVGQDTHGRAAGSVMTVEFELGDQRFIALNGGPAFKFNEAVSLMVECRDQDEVDRYWTTLGAGGDERAQQCGWLKDRYGLSWQITPRRLLELVGNDDRVLAAKAMAAMMEMKKIDIAAIERACA